MQTISTQKEQTNYWLENNKKRNESQHFFSKTPYLTVDYKITFYEHSFDAISSLPVPSPGKPPTRIKNDIQFFSKDSRTRLIKLFSQIKLSEYCAMNFVTLTFHEDYPKDNKTLKIWLGNFLKKIKRMYPNLDYLWRFEMQERGAPHFHFIFLPTNKMKGIKNETLNKQIRKLFFDSKVCGCKHCLKYGFDFIPLEYPAKAFSYVSKYCAKTNEQIVPLYNGRKWGYKSTLNRSSIETLSLRGYQFVYLKKILSDFYREIVGKRTYLDANIQSFFSFFLLCDTHDIAHLIHKALHTSLKEIFNELQDCGIISKEKIFDKETLFLFEYCHNNLN